MSGRFSSPCVSRRATSDRDSHDPSLFPWSGGEGSGTGHPLEPPVRSTCLEVAEISRAGSAGPLRLRVTRTAASFYVRPAALASSLPLTFLVGLHHGARAVIREEVEKLAVAGARAATDIRLPKRVDWCHPPPASLGFGCVERAHLADDRIRPPTCRQRATGLATREARARKPVDERLAVDALAAIDVTRCASGRSAQAPRARAITSVCVCMTRLAQQEVPTTDRSSVSPAGPSAR